jgi:hypothetical protein
MPDAGVVIRRRRRRRCAVALACTGAGLRTVLLERGTIACETSSTGMGT